MGGTTSIQCKQTKSIIQRQSPMAQRGQQITKTVQNYSYSLARSLGKGFSSTVYLGTNKLNNQQVAIKVIDLHRLYEATMHKLLHSEIEIVKKLDHVNVLKCVDVFMTANNCYIVTELCGGGDLAAEIKKKGRLRGVEALRVMLEIARGVEYLAGMNVVHRDIKPANILLQKGGGVKIADFGFAKMEVNEGRRERYSVGSPLYMSPEALFSNFYSKENDIWSLGVVFYQILQGRPPWDPKNQKQLKAILSEKKEIIFRIAVRDELQTIIRGCLKHQRSERLKISQIIRQLQHMMQQMMSDDNVAYRETLTKRTQNTISCKQLTQVTHLVPPPIIRTVTHKQLPKVPIACEIGSNKENSLKKDEGAVNVQELVKNQSEANLKSVSLEQASRHNHSILKAVINFARLIFKSFPRMEKLEVAEQKRNEVQSTMVSLLFFVMGMLKKAVSNAEDGHIFGLANFDKFKETLCFTKTVLVINEYSDRYGKFLNKLKKTLADKRVQCPEEKDLQGFHLRLKKSLQNLHIHLVKTNHNLALDFLITITVLTEMLHCHDTFYFAQKSHIELIVETEPTPLTEDSDLQQLKAKLASVVQSY